MKAAVIYANGGPEALRHEEVLDPPSGELHVEIDRSFALAEAAAADAYIEGRKAFGRVVLMP